MNKSFFMHMVCAAFVTGAVCVNCVHAADPITGSSSNAGRMYFVVSPMYKFADSVKMDDGQGNKKEDKESKSLRGFGGTLGIGYHITDVIRVDLSGGYSSESATLFKKKESGVRIWDMKAQAFAADGYDNDMTFGKKTYADGTVVDVQSGTKVYRALSDQNVTVSIKPIMLFLSTTWDIKTLGNSDFYPYLTFGVGVTRTKFTVSSKYSVKEVTIDKAADTTGNKTTPAAFKESEATSEKYSVHTKSINRFRMKVGAGVMYNISTDVSLGMKYELHNTFGGKYKLNPVTASAMIGAPKGAKAIALKDFDGTMKSGVGHYVVAELLFRFS